MLKYPGMFKPWELDDLTLAEYCWLLEYDPTRSDPHGGRGAAMSGMDAVEAHRRWHSMTPRQRLEALDAE